MRKVPVNADCDPRITCQLSVQYKRCMEADNKMKDITNASDPKQVCSGVSSTKFGLGQFILYSLSKSCYWKCVEISKIKKYDLTF